MEITAKNPEYNPILQATAALLRRCDGAASLDGQGFNKFDAGFVRNLFYKGYPLTDKQVNALRKTIQKYKGQLSSMGIDYDTLPKVIIEEKPKITIPKSAYSFKINFGKMKGMSLGTIAEKDLDYIQWLAKDSYYPDIKVAAQAVLDGKELTLKQEPTTTNITAAEGKYGPVLVITGPYNAKIKEICQDLRGYWNGKSWEVKAEHYAVLKNILNAHQKTVQWSDDAIKIGTEASTPTIVINGSTCKITGVQDSIKDEVDNTTKYWFQGAEFTEKYKSGEWDGYVHLFKSFKGEFPIGYLLPTLDILTKHHLQAKIIDNRRQPEQHEFYYNNTRELRAYQLKVVTQAVLAQQAAIILPTGAGKTEVAMSIIHVTKASTIVIVHRKELLYQWQKRLRETFPSVIIGLIGDGHKEEALITVAMIQTVSNYQLQQKYDCLIVDEGHHTPADTYYNFCMQLDAYFRFVLTATPQREAGDEKKIWAMTGYPVAGITAEELMDDGYLAASEFLYLTMPSRLVEDNTWQQELAFICEDEDDNNLLIEEITKQFKNGENIYVDVRRVEHGKVLTKMLQDSGVPAKFIYGSDSTKKRQLVLQEFSTGTIIMVSTLIKEGVDLPAMSCIVLADPARGSAENLQKVGRALRPKVNGQKAKIIDRYDNFGYLKDWFQERQQVFAQQYGKYFTAYKKVK